MKRSTIATGVVLLAVAIALTSVAVRSCANRRSSGLAPLAEGSRHAADGEAVSRLHSIPLYRAWIRPEALRSGTLDAGGTLRVEVDLRAVVRPHLAALGLADASDLLPRTARGTIARESESWSFEGPAPLLDLLDRNPAGSIATIALDAIPGAPSALVRVCLIPARLADPSLGGAAFASWRDRAHLAEKLLGRPLRAEIAEDLAGPAVFALYDTDGTAEAEALIAVELRRSDRLAGLLEMAFGLGALTERATVVRYRGVPTGSFRSETGGPGLALAVDGPILLAATSRARLEAAIDARRAAPHPPRIMDDPAASWSAVSKSAFVAHGWARLAHAADETPGTRSAWLRPEGENGWRLTGHGPVPVIGADPIVPFVRSVVGRRQRD